MAQNTYQVILQSGNIRKIVNVFANSQAEAINNARNQANPGNPLSSRVLSVNSINVCSGPINSVNGLANEINTFATSGRSGFGINNY